MYSFGCRIKLDTMTIRLPFKSRVLPAFIAAGALATALLVGCNKQAAGPNNQDTATTAAAAAQPTPAAAAPAAPASAASTASVPANPDSPAPGNPAAAPSASPVAATPTAQPAIATPAPTQAASAPPAAAPVAAANPAPAVEATPPPPPAPKFHTVPAGTKVMVRVNETLDAKKVNVGQGFTGTLVQSISVDGKVAFKSGTPVTGTVVAAKGRGKFKGEGNLGIQLSNIGNYTISSSEYEVEEKGKGKRSAAMVGGGAGGGALIGGLAGGGKGAGIGALVGAGAGTVGALATGNKDVSIPAETIVTFSLTASVRVK
jgi:hypothetical protein